MEIETKFFIANLRNARKGKKISLINLALSVGISHSHLYYIESGKVIPSVDLAIKLAKAVDLDVRNIFASPNIMATAKKENVKTRTTITHSRSPHKDLHDTDT